MARYRSEYSCTDSYGVTTVSNWFANYVKNGQIHWNYFLCGSWMYHV